MKLFDPLREHSFDTDSSAWLHFNGSYGDLFYIASMLHASSFFDYGFKVLSPIKHFDLLRVFTGDAFLLKYAAFYPDEDEQQVFEYYLQTYHTFRSDIYDPMVFPKGYLLCPLITFYPHLRSLFSHGEIAYYIALQQILKTRGFNQFPIMPYYYSQKDRKTADLIFRSCDVKERTTLYHPVNHTNFSLSKDQIKTGTELLRRAGCKIAFNVAQCDASLREFLQLLGPCIDIPIHILPLVQSRFQSVSGVTGGGLSIAQSFSSCNVISIHTKSRYHPSSEKDTRFSGIGYSLFTSDLKNDNRSSMRKRKTNDYVVALNGVNDVNLQAFFSKILSLS
jgi:hypothetical protein